MNGGTEGKEKGGRGPGGEFDGANLQLMVKVNKCRFMIQRTMLHALDPHHKSRKDTNHFLVGMPPVCNFTLVGCLRYTMQLIKLLCRIGSLETRILKLFSLVIQISGA
jgi:hypothetical protein